MVTIGQFKTYELIRKTGVVNMDDVKAVSRVSNKELSTKDVELINKNYKRYLSLGGNMLK